MVVIKSVRAVISVAGSEVEVFMLPSGEYRYSQTSAAAVLGCSEGDIRQYLRLTNPEAVEGAIMLAVGRTRVKGLTSLAVMEYWHWKAENGNKEAKALVRALTNEALERRADTAFGQTKTEEQYEEQTTKVRLELLQQYADSYKWLELDRATGHYRHISPDERTYPELATEVEMDVMDAIGHLKYCYATGADKNSTFRAVMKRSHAVLEEHGIQFDLQHTEPTCLNTRVTLTAM